MAEAYDVKRDYSTDTRESMAEEGMAMPDGSYPIKDEADLKNAIQAFGRAKDKQATMAHIRKRAKDLGLEDVLPENWSSGKSEDEDEVVVPEDADTETPEADEDLEGKAVVRINADGAVKSCAKGAVGDCAYKAGDKICGKCGAMAVMTKVAGDADFGSGMEREMDEEAPDEDQSLTRAKEVKKKPKLVGSEADQTESELVRQAALNKRRAKLAKMGKKDALDGDFLCAMQRKVLDEGTSPCEGCTGGCFPVKGGADLLEVEAMAEEMYDAEVLDSGYSEKYDKFVVDLRRKDGRLLEAVFSGSGEDEGWHPIREDALFIGDDVIGGDEAIEVAQGAIEGKALSIGVQMFDGQIAYCVEVDGKDGYSYDVFVDTEGKVLAMDQWEYETSSLGAVEEKSAEQVAIEAALMEFEALQTEEELRQQGLI